MDRRKEERYGVELSVRIWGVDSLSQPFAEMARAARISGSGAQILGFRSKLKVGDLVDVQHAGKRAQFKVVWIQSGKAGIQALPFEPSIWGVVAPEIAEYVTRA